MSRVRCHASVRDEKVIERNIVVEYPVEYIPDATAGGEIECGTVVVRPFRGECHSTVDFNGVVEVSEGRVRFIPIGEYCLL